MFVRASVFLNTSFQAVWLFHLAHHSSQLCGSFAWRSSTRGRFYRYEQRAGELYRLWQHTYSRGVHCTRIKTHNMLQVVNNVVLPTVEQCCAADPVNNLVSKIVQPCQCCYSIVQPSILLQVVDKVEQQRYITMTNKLVLSILFSPVSTTVGDRCLLHQCWTTLLKQ